VRERGASSQVLLATVAATLLLVAAPAARADVEEFSTFDIGLQEHDDESTLDHFLTRFPRAWADEWARTPMGIRTSQGCLTSGEWFVDTDLRARAPLGERAWLGVDWFQSESDIFHTTHLDLSFHFPIRFGTATAMFRPSGNKAAQDFALGWETGADTSAFQMKLVWTLEDVFNNFWAFRQTQVGNLSEPYDRRPYEPAIFLASRHAAWQVEAGAKWLTPSSKRVVDLNIGQPLYQRELWGAAGQARAEATAGRVTFELRGEARHTHIHDTPLGTTIENERWHRRQWSAEFATRVRIDPRTTAEGRYLYQSRHQGSYATTSGSRLLVVDDRMLALEVLHEFGARLTARLGGLFDRIGVARDHWPEPSYGTRNESRAYVGLAVRFGRVLVSGTEGIELDPEPYEVWAVHDKGFLQLQTSF